MTLLAPCSSCSRHVRVAESACPFCGAVVSLEAPSIRGIASQRLGRAALFTFGAVALATNASGCSTPTPAEDAGTDAYYGSIGDAYGAPDVGARYDAGHDGGLAGAYGGPPVDAAAADAGVDTGTHALYGAPPVPSPPPEQP